MKSILQSRRECYLTRCTENLHKHHIFFGPLRDIAEKNGFWVWLRADLHNGRYGVHFNRELDLRLKRECQARYEETHAREEFMKLIGRNYL